MFLFLYPTPGEASVLTEIQAGPLYRVVNTPLFISCNVSGFANSNMEKEFEFRIRKPKNPTSEINIISTQSQGFTYSIYQGRVRSNTITLKHVSPNSVLFEIQSLQKNDEGEYDCSVVNLEALYNGIYSVSTTVKVIDNSLTVSSSASTLLSYNEGDALTLTCQASSNTIQHTHLSFAWYLHKDGKDDAQVIISLDREFTLVPGPGFEERYQAGHIRLDKMGEATYRLKMAQLQLSDQGRIYCQAQEWIQDPDGSWYSLIKMDAEENVVNVKARVVPDMSSLVVKISAQQTTLQEGQELSLSCNVDTQNLEERFFSIAWLRGRDELARIGPTGILSVGPEYSVREKEGELRAARIGDVEYRLILRPVRTGDQGEYVCKAWPQDRGSDGVFTQGAATDSSSLLVSISASVEIQGTATVNEGDRLKLTCNVHGFNGQLSVTWQHKSTSPSTALFTSIITLSQEGVMEKDGALMNRKVRALRPTADSFTLEFDEVRPSDSGAYQCTVSEWKGSSKTNSQSQTTTVTVKPVGKTCLSHVSATKSEIVTIGENVELMCRVRGPRLPMTVTWSLQRDALSIDNIMTLYFDGAISWSGDQHRYQLKVENQQSQVIHSLLINSASHREAGNYQCRVSVVLQNEHKKLPPSNQLAVLVLNPVSKLRLSSPTTLTRSVSTDIEMKCSVVSEPSLSSRYAVNWLFQQQTEKKLIVSSDLDALVTFGPQVELEQKRRISMRRTRGPSFEMTIQQARISDNGSYTCEVVEWRQDPGGHWYSLSPVSTTTVLTLTEPEKNLSVERNEVELNVSGDFIIPCQITRQSSSESEFQVTWFWQEKTGTKQRPIFTVYRNSTLQDRFGEGAQLKFGHPLSSHFTLTVLKPDPKNSGLYYCEVEEWLPSLSHGWRKVAVEKSGYLTVNVITEGKCMCLARILAAVVLCLLLVIFLLVLKLCRSRVSERKKAENSLWVDELPLNKKPSAED
uniref:Immunoglobulin superfamily member 3-like n=1 Tax=Mastacembelus armatus TaxID=205130 RepID=A0A3Q3SAM5_9TELE